MPPSFQCDYNRNCQEGLKEDFFSPFKVKTLFKIPKKIWKLVEYRSQIDHMKINYDHIQFERPICFDDHKKQAKT